MNQYESDGYILALAIMGSDGKDGPLTVFYDALRQTRTDEEAQFVLKYAFGFLGKQFIPAILQSLRATTGLDIGEIFRQELSSVVADVRAQMNAEGDTE